MSSSTSNIHWDAYLQSLKPDLDIPEQNMTAQEFAETLKEYGIVCPPDSIITRVNCTREDFQGNDFTLSFKFRTKGFESELRMFITLTENSDEWFIRMISDHSDSRKLSFDSKFHYTSGIVERLLRFDSGDTLKLQLAHFTTPNETILGGNPVVFTSELEETIDISHLSAVEIINRILAAREDDLSYFRLFTDEEIAQLRN